ncbi:MAG: AAA family ATPase [Bacilli bacterium]|nr:AAA family ATPase [Bacilli bacterium]
MIKELSIKSFRNLKELKINLAQTTIITGQNELGKSNALNALMWLLTGTILTDKWGSGENDIDSIVPKDATRGINPEVEITLETGTTFSKKYITKYSKDGSKVIGHTTEFYINNVVCKNENEFKDALYPMLKYTPGLKTKDVNELRLFTDPLYALQKLDAKQLRQLLVDLGCSVSDEELYTKGFEDLRPYGGKYMGKWSVLRKDLKDKTNVLTKDIEALQAKLETVQTAEAFDETTLKELNKNLEDLIGKKANIRALNNNPEINELETKIAVLNNTISNKIANHTSDLIKEKLNLKAKRQEALDKLNNDENSKLKPIQEELNKVNNEIASLSSSMRAYQQAHDNNSQLAKSYIELGKSNQERKNTLAIRLDSVRNDEYKGKVKCPYCGGEFADSKDKEQEFLKHQQEEIESILNEINKCDANNEKYKDEYNKYSQLKREASEQLLIANNKMSELNNKAIDLQGQINKVNAEPVDMTEINKIDAEIQALEMKQPDVSEETKQLNELQTKLFGLKNSSEALIQDEINKIDIKINETREQIQQEIVNKSKFNERLEYQKKLEETQKALNDNEYLLGKVNALIYKMISMVNEKATEITGLKFVMLEENISNDGVKEVCYATIDNIPFKDINTAKKLKYGISFIERLKKILGANDMPILADRMEGIDDINKIKELTKEQLVCTRVSTEKQITII